MNEKEGISVSNDDLQKAQQMMFEMLCEVDRIFKLHNIRYCIAFGTLLGAVRHKGFIPWDDDIDVHVFNEDYNLALQVLAHELNNEKFVLHSKENDPNYWYTTAKVKSLKTFVERTGIDKETKYRYRGVWVSLLLAQKAKRYNRFIYWLLKVLIHARDYNQHENGISNFIKTLIAGLSVPVVKFVYLIFDFLPGRNVRILGNTGWKGEYFDESDILPFFELEFMGKFFPVPRDYRKILIGSYGNDYMVPPPLDKRPLHFNVIRFLDQN
jgi:lipopolysaccharide cholinephosphotransferase